MACIKESKLFIPYALKKTAYSKTKDIRMADIRTYLDYLNESIEIAPTNSQEELDAAELIEKLMRDHNLELHRQDVVSHGWGIVVHDSLYIVLFIGMLISGFTGTFVSYFGFIVCLAATVLLVLEKLHIFEISSFGPLAQSQNIIGVHRATGPLVMKGNRPIVVVAHYDTPNEDILSKPQFAPYQARLKKLVYSAVLFTMFCALVQVALFLPFLNDIIRRAFWLLGVLSAFSFLALGVNSVYKKFASCTEGANSNKSSLAAMMDVINTVRPEDDEASRWGYVHPQKTFSEVEDMPQENDTSFIPALDSKDANATEELGQRSSQSTEERITKTDKINAVEVAPADKSSDVGAPQMQNLDASEDQGIELRKDPLDMPSEVDNTGNVAQSVDEYAATQDSLDTPMDTKQADATKAAVSSENQDNATEKSVEAPEVRNVDKTVSGEPSEPKVIGYDVEDGVVRRGKDTLLKLDLLPQDCEVEYTVGLQYEKTQPKTPSPQKFEVLHNNAVLPQEEMSSTPDANDEKDALRNDAQTEQRNTRGARTSSRDDFVAPTFEEDYPLAEWKAVSDNAASLLQSSDGESKDDQQEQNQESEHSVDKDAKDGEDGAVPSDSESAHDDQQEVAEKTESLDVAKDEQQASDKAQTSEEEKPLSAEEAIISQIHQEVQARTQRDDVQVADASQILKDEQNALGGAAMVRRAALFDLPDPREQVQDPFVSEDSESNADDLSDRDALGQKSLDSHVNEKTITFTPQETPAVQVSHDAVNSTSDNSSSSDKPEASNAPSKKKRTLGLFGRKKKEAADKDSMSSWLGVDDSFDAKKDGRQIGSWDNFVHEEDNSNQASSHPKSWKGGATTRVGLRVHDGIKGTQPQDLPSVDDVEAHTTTANESEDHTLSLKHNPFVQGGIVDAGVASAASGNEDTVHSDARTSDAVSDENIPEKTALWEDAKKDAVKSTSSKLKQKDKPVSSDEQIQELKDAVLSMGSDELLCHDIWFVALGASENNHAGMKQFLSEYRREIRGAFLINLDCVGAGSLTVLTAEDPYNTRRADRRITRLLSKIAEDLHIQLQKRTYDYGRTDATPAMHASVRSATIMGCDENGLPALAHTQADVAHMIDAKQVKQVAQMVCELIRRA